MSDLEAAMIDKVASQLAEIAGRPLDPTAFGKDLEICVARYKFAQYCDGPASD